MSEYRGDFVAGSTVRLKFDTSLATGASGTFTGTTIRVYKDGSITERTSSAGITLSKDFDGMIGCHHVDINTADNTDPGFYAAGHDYSAALVGATIDGQTVNAWIGEFSIENRTAWGKTCTEPTAVPSAAPTAIQALSWLYTLSRNTITQTSTVQTLLADNGTTTIATSTVSDSGTTFTRGEFS